MKKIGYILSDRKIKDIMDGIEIVNNFDLIPTNYPYLIVGLENAKKNVKNFSILNKKIDDLGFWTFGKTERRNDFEKDVNGFYQNIINNIINNIKYYYIDILKIKYNKFKKLYNIINSSNLKYIYISNNMIYIYTDGYILGLSLQILEYCGFNIDKLLNKIGQNEHNVMYSDDSFLSNKMKSFIKDKKYLIPYFMSLQ